MDKKEEEEKKEEEITTAMQCSIAMQWNCTYVPRQLLIFFHE